MFLAQLCLTLFDPIDCSPPGSSVQGVLQARILEWVSFPPPGDLSNSGINPESLALAGGFLPLSYQGILINAYIHMESRKMVLMNLFAGQE